MGRTWGEVRDRIQTASRKIWLEEPLELKKLRMGIIDSGAGTYGQYFSTLVFAEGDIRALGAYCAGGLAKCAALESITLQQLKDMVEIFLPVSANFLGYCGMKSVWGFTQDIMEVLPTIETKEQFRELLIAFARYALMLHIWVNNYFPWELGLFFPQRDKEYTKELLRLLQGE
jgi:hypothetical protein